MNIKEAAWILSNNGIDGAPVVENKNVVGILTLSDITKAIANQKEDFKVEEIMSKHIITVEEDLLISDAIEIMNKNKIGRVIVINDDKLPVGIVTKTDILNKIAGLK
jgi:predicted transcriptional regulator